jgi:hypothetical protein
MHTPKAKPVSNTSDSELVPTPHVEAAGMLRHGNTKLYAYSVDEEFNAGDELILQTRFGLSRADIVKEIMHGNGRKLVFIEFKARERQVKSASNQKVTMAEVLAAQLAANAELLNEIKALRAK